MALNIDLHRHLDGNIRVSTILDLAHKHSIALPSTDLSTLTSIVHIKDKTSNLLEFLNRLDIGVSVLADSDACYQVAYENVVDIKTEGLDYAELRFSPVYMAESADLSLDKVVQAVVEGVKDAKKDHKVNVNLIGILSRTYGAEMCMKELDAILKAGQGVVAIDLAGDELNYPAKMFVEHFNKADAHGLKATVHAGEADGPNSIWDAIRLLKATRIGHGVAAVKDLDLMQYMKENHIGIESCILSNYQTGTWTDIPSHPVKQFLENGLLVNLNTDDPGVSNNTLFSEFELAKTSVKLTDAQILKLQKNSLEMAFMSDSEKAELLKTKQ